MEPIYLGRIVVVARTTVGRLAAIYRVSSRSFPNRRPVVREETASIVPKEGHETDVHKNPYIAYNCARLVGDVAIVSNGAHTDPIAERVASGMSLRDALTYPLAVMDYEHDDYNTPRIAAAFSREDDCGWLGVVREDGLDVRRFALNAGECYYVSTYEHNVPNGHYRCDFAAVDATGACAFVLGEGEFARFTHPIAAVCVAETGSGFEMATKEAEQ